MEKFTTERHVAVIENCVMTEVGIRALLEQHCGVPCHLHSFKQSQHWFTQREHPAYDFVIYSVSGTRHSRQECLQFLESLARAQPETIRVLLAEDERQARLIHHLSPVRLHAVLCKTVPVDVLKTQIKALWKRKDSQNVAFSEVNCFSGTVGLSPTERTVLYHMGRGLSVPEIAVQMARNTKTIRTHKFNAMTKLGVSNDTGLLCAADILRHLPCQAVELR